MEASFIPLEQFQSHTFNSWCPRTCQFGDEYRHMESFHSSGLNSGNHPLFLCFANTHTLEKDVGYLI